MALPTGLTTTLPDASRVCDVKPLEGEAMKLLLNRFATLLKKSEIAASSEELGNLPDHAP